MQQKICTAGMLPRVIIKRGRPGATSLQERFALFEHTFIQKPPHVSGAALSGVFPDHSRASLVLIESEPKALHSCFDAFSSREPVFASAENALSISDKARSACPES
jgi:hypothetical protein